MSREAHKQRLLGKLARGMAYTGPVFAVVMGASAFNVSASEVSAEPGYMMLAAGEAEAEGEAGKKAMAKVRLKAKPKVKPREKEKEKARRREKLRPDLVIGVSRSAAHAHPICPKTENKG